MVDYKSILTAEFAPLFSLKGLRRDISAGLVVFLVALPLCLGIAQASGTPPITGLLAGIIGGIVVGALSGSHTSVSGPAAGLTAILVVQIEALGGTIEALLVAVVIGGVLQIGLGLARAGALSAFVPSSVIKGLLAAIGVLLILKQLPHLLGHDEVAEGVMSAFPPDAAFTPETPGAATEHPAEGHDTLSEILSLFTTPITKGPAAIGVLSIALLILWNNMKMLKNSLVPGPLLVVLLGVGMYLGFQHLDSWAVTGSHLVSIPEGDFWSFFRFPDFSKLTDFSGASNVYIAGITIGIVASLETLLNLEAVDKLDKMKRHSPASRELLAQGVGNMLSGFIGGIPMTSVIVRSSVNTDANVATKRSAILHGFLLLFCVLLLPTYLSMIPKAALAAILIVIGAKLASPSLFVQMWKEGRYQFIPFMVTLIAIVTTDLLIGIGIGLCVSLCFILYSNLRRPIRQILETHHDGDVLHIELANQVSFLNRAALDELINKVESGTNVLIDASGADYIDPDILSLLREFKDQRGPARNVTVSFRGFRDRYELQNEIQFADYSSRDMQDRISPEEVLEILIEGNRRFVDGKRLTRDLGRQVGQTATGQNPLAVVLGCIDSRVPAEIVFDLGIGDIFNVRVAGNVIGTKSLGSIEYGVGVAGVKLVLVLGHTRCGAVTSSLQLLSGPEDIEQATGCTHLAAIVQEIEESISREDLAQLKDAGAGSTEAMADDIARRNVFRTVGEITSRSRVIRDAVDTGKVMVAGAIYDVKSGKIEVLQGSPEFNSQERV